MNITRTSVCWMIQGLLVITWNIWAILNQSRPDSKYPLKGSLYWPQAECCRPHHGISRQDPFPSNVMLTRWIRASIPSQLKVSQWTHSLWWVSQVHTTAYILYLWIHYPNSLDLLLLSRPLLSCCKLCRLACVINDERTFNWGCCRQARFVQKTFEKRLIKKTTMNPLGRNPNPIHLFVSKIH